MCYIKDLNLLSRYINNFNVTGAREEGETQRERRCAPKVTGTAGRAAQSPEVAGENEPHPASQSRLSRPDQTGPGSP